MIDSSSLANHNGNASYGSMDKAYGVNNVQFDKCNTIEGRMPEQIEETDYLESTKVLPKKRPSVEFCGEALVCIAKGKENGRILPRRLTYEEKLDLYEDRPDLKMSPILAYENRKATEDRKNKILASILVVTLVLLAVLLYYIMATLGNTYG